MMADINKISVPGISRTVDQMKLLLPPNEPVQEIHIESLKTKMVPDVCDIEFFRMLVYLAVREQEREKTQNIPFYGYKYLDNIISEVKYQPKKETSIIRCPDCDTDIIIHISEG